MIETPFAIVLGLAAIIAALLGARTVKQSRGYVLLGAALYGALAIGEAISASVPFTNAIALLVSSLVPALLAFALIAALERLPHPAIVTAILILCLIEGIAAAMSGAALLAFAPLFAAVCAMLVMALRHRSLHAGAAGLAFIAAASCFMAGGRIAFALFSAAGLLGIALASNLRVEHQRDARRAVSIRRPR